MIAKLAVVAGSIPVPNILTAEMISKNPGDTLLHTSSTTRLTVQPVYQRQLAGTASSAEHGKQHHGI
jgi:hypothetical protein